MMKYLKLFEEFSSIELEKSIKNLKKLPKELKQSAIELSKEYSMAKNGKVTGLKIHKDLKKKISKKKYPSGFDMGVDKNGYFIHTHRARSKSHENPGDITAREIKFIDSTG